MLALTDFIDSIFHNTSLSEEDKRELAGIYLIRYYQTVLELVLGLKGADGAAVKAISDTLEAGIKSLERHDQELVMKTLEDQKAQILLDLVEKVEELKPEEKARIETNLKTWLAKSS